LEHPNDEDTHHDHKPGSIVLNELEKSKNKRDTDMSCIFRWHRTNEKNSTVIEEKQKVEQEINYTARRVRIITGTNRGNTGSCLRGMRQNKKKKTSII
jgi:hypothetical protein